MSNFTNEQIDYIIQWMNSWEQLRGTAIPIRFKEVFSKQKCIGEFGCMYSRSSHQPYPRLCIHCGYPELIHEPAIDHDAVRILGTPTLSSTQMVELFIWLQQRDLALQKIKDYPKMQADHTVEFIKAVNEKIKQILHL